MHNSSRARNGGNAGNANLLIGKTGNANLPIGQKSTPVWHREYWDRFIRNDRHFQQAVQYIHENPMKAGLVGRPQDWRWSSASVTGDCANRDDANQEIGVPGDDPREPAAKP